MPRSPQAWPNGWNVPPANKTSPHVALGGGCFLNDILLRTLSDRLAAQGLRVLTAQRMQPNDSASRSDRRGSRCNPSNRKYEYVPGIPACVEQLMAGDSAIVNLGGVRKEISLALVEDVAVGDYVIVHVGFALQKLDPKRRRRRWRCLRRSAEPRRHEIRRRIPRRRAGKNIAANIAREADPRRRYHLMEFCGGHTHAISRYGLADLLPGQCAHDPRPRLPGVRAADRGGWKMPSSWRKRRG